MEGYAKQMAEFSSFADLDEVQRYLKKAKNLNSKLEAAVDKIEGFNAEEDAFDWERTQYPLRKKLANELSHYLKLYDKIVEFNDKHECVVCAHGICSYRYIDMLRCTCDSRK